MSDSKFFYSEQDSDAEFMDSAATLVSLLINAAERGVMVLPPVHLCGPCC